MKIGIDARMYGYAQTGIGNYIRHLLKNILEVDKENKYVVFLLPSEFDSFNVPGEKVKKVKVRSKWYSFSEQFLLPIELYREKLDLMHFTHFNSPILYFKKSVVTIHDVIPHFFPGRKMKSAARKAAFKAVFSSSIAKASKIITVSQNTKTDIVRYFRADNNKIIVIYLGVDNQFRKQRDKKVLSLLREKYNINKPFIFYTGVWRNHKNLAGLIRAYHILKNKYKLNCNLVFGGKEDLHYQEARKLWENLKLEKDIVRVGFIDQKELPIFYNSAEVFVIPSFYEGFGLVGLEAMACGTPVVSSNKASLPEILGDCALYFDPENPEEMAEKINMVLSNKVLRNELAKKGLEQAKEYNWKKMARETLEVYKSLL